LSARSGFAFAFSTALRAFQHFSLLCRSSLTQLRFATHFSAKKLSQVLESSELLYLVNKPPKAT
jgi:hypothetical protein